MISRSADAGTTARQPPRPQKRRSHPRARRDGPRRSPLRTRRDGRVPRRGAGSVFRAHEDPPGRPLRAPPRPRHRACTSRLRLAVDHGVRDSLDVVRLDERLVRVHHRHIERRGSTPPPHRRRIRNGFGLLPSFSSSTRTTRAPNARAVSTASSSVATTHRVTHFAACAACHAWNTMGWFATSSSGQAALSAPRWRTR